MPRGTPSCSASATPTPRRHDVSGPSTPAGGTGDRPAGLGSFLSARRAAVDPDAAGVRYSGHRRVRGLRREEVAVLAGVSADYYARLEQGRERHPSPQVLDALSRALHLDDDAREHLHRLAGAVPALRGAATSRTVSPELLQLLDRWPDTPALVVDDVLDVLAENQLAAALHSGFTGPLNLLRMVFTDPAGRTFYADWHRAAQSTVAALRLAAGHSPDDPRVRVLVEELTTASAEFRVLWTRQDVRGKTHEAKEFAHPDVGSLTLGYQAFDVRSAPGHQLIVYQAEPGSPSDAALQLLASLAATTRPELLPESSDRPPGRG